MAIYGALGDIDVGAISKSISATASDIFVYDTRKDSDGGAWRKRTQHTSWYNETLNTATRGSRKDFPAVAVIVGYNDVDKGLVIYDGDDPDFPMWMVFEHTSFGALNNNNPTYGTNSVAMLNGKLCAAVYNGSSTGGLAIIDFLEDSCYRSHQSTTSYVGYSFRGTKIAPGILNRNFQNTGFDGRLGKYSDWIVNSTANDVAMTVLPNAPIDPSTGLPVPTIAVATAGGVSVIRDDGTVENTDIASIYKIGFVKGDRLAYGHRGGYEYAGRAINVSPFRNSLQYGYYINNSVPSFGNLIGSAGIILGVGDGNIYGYSTEGIRRIFEDETNKANGMANYITTSYNTGWMHGDIKGAFLSDTSTASVTGELVTNGNFSSALGSEWVNYGGSNSATFQIVSGELEVTENGSADYGIVYQTVPVVSGRQYIASVTSRSSGTGTARWFIGSMGNDGIVGVVDTTSTSSVTNVRYFTATTTGNIVLQLSALNASNARAYFDNVSVRLAEPDRSVNNTGLAVYGTITKTPVATGADLVGYNGWSSSNYLRRPYISFIDNPGSGNYSIIFWAKCSVSHTGVIWSIRDPNNPSNNWMQVWFDNTYLTFLQTNGGTLQTTSVNYYNNQWNCYAIVKSSGIGHMYENGVLKTSVAITGDPGLLSTCTYTIGAHYDNAYPVQGSLALLRYSLSAPSSEQILKIYNDEKALFQENSKSTLYGSSDAVTALAYDDTTRLLHVGTSSGRSDFQGLERINNTTTAVTTAISASNGLIAEQ